MDRDGGGPVVVREKRDSTKERLLNQGQRNHVETIQLAAITRCFGTNGHGIASIITLPCSRQRPSQQ